MRKLLVLILFLPGLVFAQSKMDYLGKNVKSELAFHMGRLLPNQVEGATEIIPQWGVRGAYRAYDFFYDWGYQGGAGYGVKWNQLDVGIRLDVPIENLVGTMGIGLDTTMYQGENLPFRTYFGGHVTCGMMSLISHTLWFRADMKFNFTPATSLYIGFGFVFRFGGAGGGGGNSEI